MRFGSEIGCTYRKPEVSHAHGLFVGVSQLPIVDELRGQNITDPPRARKEAPILLL